MCGEKLLVKRLNSLDYFFIFFHSGLFCYDKMNSEGNFVALNTYLEPIYKILEEENVTEISINKPQECWVEKLGKIYSVSVPTLTYKHLYGMAKLIAQSTDQMVSEEKPLLSGTLPNGCRVQVVLPPVCNKGTVAFSIRKPTTIQYTLEDYEKMGAFEKSAISSQQDRNDFILQALLERGRIKDFLRGCVRFKKNLIISGGTSTGKTTFTNALLQEIPKDERLITVEDAREIVLEQHPNCLNLVASKGGQGRANVSTQDLIEACLRLRPDRIIVGEIRGKEAFSFLRAINTGHPGSISTLHADAPAMAIEQLKLMVMQAGLGMSPEEVKNYITQVIDVIIQLKRGENGIRFVSEVKFLKQPVKLNQQTHIKV